VAAIFPGVMTPVPPLKTAVSAADPPAVIVVGAAAKLVIDGAAGAVGFTVTVAVWVTAVPDAFFTVSVYDVVLDGETITVDPLVAAMFPGVIIPVPLAKTPNRLAEPPGATDSGLAVKLEMVGFGTVKENKVPFVQPVRLVKHRMRNNAKEKQTVARFISAPETEARKWRSVLQLLGLSKV
jgi:hypothetical protein